MSFAEEVDSLHLPWQLPFEVVDVAPHQPAPIWGVVLDDGNVLNDTEHWVYALVARVNHRDHVLCADEQPREIARKFLESQAESQAAWLLRLPRRRGAELGKNHDVIPGDLSVTVFRGPEPIEPRLIRDKDIALLMDYGKVLCHYDYSWFTWGYAAVFGNKPPSAALVELEQFRPAFESGQIAEDDFFQLACRHLNLDLKDRDLFESAWSNIVRLNDDMVALTRRAIAQDGWAMSIVSNIDPIMVRNTRDRLGLNDLFDGGVYSFLDGVRPKHEDGSMWRMARQSCANRLGTEPVLTLAVDDIAANLNTAAKEPLVSQTIQFRNPYQWWYDLGAAGAYLPRVRRTTSRAQA